MLAGLQIRLKSEFNFRDLEDQAYATVCYILPFYTIFRNRHINLNVVKKK